MLAQISFTADKALKKKVIAKAKKKGITMKALLVLSMEAFVNNKINLGIIDKADSDVKELYIDDDDINENAMKLVDLLK